MPYVQVSTAEFIDVLRARIARLDGEYYAACKRDGGICKTCAGSSCPYLGRMDAEKTKELAAENACLDLASLGISLPSVRWRKALRELRNYEAENERKARVAYRALIANALAFVSAEARGQPDREGWPDVSAEDVTEGKLEAERIIGKNEDLSCVELRRILAKIILGST